MKKDLAARQLVQTRKEMERDLKRRDRERLRSLRGSLTAAKAAKAATLRAVTAACVKARKANAAKAKRARLRLQESLRRTREQARSLCATSRGEAHAATLAAIERAVMELEKERTVQRQLAIWTRPKSCPVSAGRTRTEKRQESDCEVAANIDDPGLRVVWEHVKKRIKATPRRTRTESFLEWVAEHSGEVYEIQERDAVRALEQLEREERRMARELSKPMRYARRTPAELSRLLADVPF